MNRRLEFHQILCAILGTQDVYFQPPPSIQMKFPCIVYSLKSIFEDYGDDRVYMRKKAYDVVYISDDPDAIIPDNIAKLEYASYNNQFVTDNLYHTTYTVYY